MNGYGDGETQRGALDPNGLTKKYYISVFLQGALAELGLISFQLIGFDILLRYFKKGTVHTMILVIAATDIEMSALRRLEPKNSRWTTLVTGVGLASTALQLTKYLCSDKGAVEGVVNFGVGGAYHGVICGGVSPQLLDICIASSEVYGDLGICMGDSVEYLRGEITGKLELNLASEFGAFCEKALDINEIPYLKGGFVSVNAASGRRVRGEMLQKRWNGLCENMEGAAAAEVCDTFSLPFFEIRCISNMVEDRNPANWRLSEACDKAARVTATLLNHVTGAK